MRIIIFGATGMLGKQLVKQALYNGNQVTAFGRNVFTEDFPDDKNLQLVQGAVFDAGQVYNAVKGAGAVLSALEGNTHGADFTRSLGMKNIVAQMEKAKLKRIVAVGGEGCLENEEGLLLMDEPDFPKDLLEVSQEHYKAYQYLKASSLDWTFVCPPSIHQAEATGEFATEAEHLPSTGKGFINTGDLAFFMLGELDRNAFLHHRVGISN